MRRLIILAFWVIFSTPVGFAVEIPASGRVFLDTYVPLNSGKSFSDSEMQQASASVWLQVDPKLDEKTWAHVVFTGTDFAASSAGVASGLQLRLREGVVHVYRFGMEVAIGKMILPWGKSDMINPTDFLTAKDYTFFNPDEEVRRVGASSVMFTYTPNDGISPWSFTVISTPSFPKSRLVLAPGQIPTAVTGATTVLSPPNIMSNHATAVKVSYAGQEWDASVSVYRGWNTLPEFELASVTGTGGALGIQVNQTFHRYRAIGMDGSTTLGGAILRGEGAYVWTENDDGQNPLIQPSHLDAVVGVEHPLGSEFRIQVQGVARYFPRYLSPSQFTVADSELTTVYQQIASMNALIQNYQNPFRPMTTLRLSYINEPSGWGGDFAFLLNLVGGGMLARPQVTYRPTDALKTTIGFDLYGGPKDQPLGVMGPFTAFYTELKYAF